MACLKARDTLDTVSVMLVKVGHTLETAIMRRKTVNTLNIGDQASENRPLSGDGDHASEDRPNPGDGNHASGNRLRHGDGDRACENRPHPGNGDLACEKKKGHAV